MNNTITQEIVDTIYNNSQKYVKTLFDKMTLVSIQLPNGFCITESSACVDPENFSMDIGYEICENRIKNKIWELEGYKLQCEISSK